MAAPVRRHAGCSYVIPLPSLSVVVPLVSVPLWAVSSFQLYSLMFFLFLSLLLSFLSLGLSSFSVSAFLFIFLKNWKLTEVIHVTYGSGPQSLLGKIRVPKSRVLLSEWIYSRTSMARTLMAHLPQLFQTRP